MALDSPQVLVEVARGMLGIVKHALSVKEERSEVVDMLHTDQTDLDKVFLS